MLSDVKCYDVAARQYQTITGKPEVTNERSFRTHPSFGSGNGTLSRYKPYCLCRLAQSLDRQVVHQLLQPAKYISQWGDAFITTLQQYGNMTSLLAIAKANHANFQRGKY